MRTGIGIIDEIKKDGMAKIKVSDESVYVACNACSAIGHVYVTAHNPIGAKEGDTVRYEVEDRNQIVTAFMTFMVPFLAMFLGGIVGALVGDGSYIVGMIGVIIGFGIAVLIMKRYDGSIRSQMKEPKILEIIETES